MTPSMLTAQEARTPDEIRMEAAKCARRINTMLDACQYDEARHQLSEAKRLSLLATELERERAA